MLPHQNPQNAGVLTEPSLQLSTAASRTHFSNLLPVLAAEIGAAHIVCVKRGSEFVEAAVQVGRLLTEAKEQVPHGSWVPWLAASVPNLSARTAQRYMKAAESAAEKRHVSFFNLRSLTAPSHEHIGKLGEGRVLILSPSTNPGYTHLSVLDAARLYDGGGRPWTFSPRPIRNRCLRLIVESPCHATWPTKWASVPATPAGKNPWLTAPFGEFYDRLCRLLDKLSEAPATPNGAAGKRVAAHYGCADAEHACLLAELSQSATGAAA